MTELTDDITGLIGLGVAAGFTITTLKALQNLTPKIKNEIESILNKSTKIGKTYELKVRHSKLQRVRRILSLSGFKLVNQYELGDNVTLVIFEEKY